MGPRLGEEQVITDYAPLSDAASALCDVHVMRKYAQTPPMVHQTLRSPHGALMKNGDKTSWVQAQHRNSSIGGGLGARSTARSDD